MTTDPTRCVRCGVELHELTAVTKRNEPLCSYCPLGMDPESYDHVGGEPIDDD